MKLLPVALLLLSGASRAAETASFLNIGVGARGLAMGGAYTALADDASALAWNAAGLSSLEKRELTTSHSTLAFGTRHDFAAYAQPTAGGTFAVGAIYLSRAAIAGRDELGHPTASYGASDAALAAGWGKNLGLASAGVAVKYIRSHIASAEAHTVAVDAGLRRELGSLIIGAAVRNLGAGLKYDGERNDLPLRVAAGAACKLPGGHALAAELIDGPREAGFDGSVGGEYQAIRSVFLRAGWSSEHRVEGGSGFEAARGLTLGVGYRDARWDFAYAVLPMGELGNSHRFTVGSRF